MPASPTKIQLTVHLYSYFKELAECSSYMEEVPAGSTLGALLESLDARFPKLSPMKKSMLTAVGVEYQDRGYVLRPGDEVSLFPPVQGG